MRKSSKFLCGAGTGGYTLIELAMVMVVAGLMVASFMTAYNLYYKTQAEQITDERVSQITATLSQYLVVFGSYPCPAPLDVPRSDPKYGMAGQCDPKAAGYDGPAVGTFGNGFYEETSNRKLVTPVTNALIYPACEATDVPSCGAPTTGPVDTTTGATLGAHSPRVRRGMLPFRTLGLQEDQAYDGYKMRLQYAVTEALAVPRSYLRQAGAIDIQDGAGHSLVKAPDMPDANFTVGVQIKSTGGSAHYVIFSAGEDRQGAYNRDGKLFAPCPATGLDAENCNTTTNSAAVYNFVARSTANGATHYDDHMKYYSEIETPLWQVSTSFGKDITDVITASGGAARIGIGSAPSAAVPATMQVSGDVHASTKLAASQLCAAGGTKCLNTDLTSTPCPAGQYATRLLNGQLQCTASGASNTLPCDPGKIAHGFNSQGKLICSTVVTCPLTPVTLCQPPTVAANDVRWLPASTDGTVLDTRNLAPLGRSGDPIYLAGPPTNTYGYYETWKCQGGSWNITSAVDQCTCIPYTGTVPMDCSAYYGYGAGTFIGTLTSTTTTVCPSGVTTTVNNAGTACTCNSITPPTTTTSTSTNCPQGYSGGPIVTTTNGTWQCGPPKRWNYTTTTTGTCTCNTGSTKTQNVACPFGYSGTVTQTSALDCSTGNWSTWTPAMTNPPPTGPGQCTCIGGTDYQTVGCGTGQLGTKDQKRTFDCTASPPDWTAWSTIDDTRCAAITYSWRPVGTPTSCTTALSYNLYDTCTTPGTSVSCSSPNGSSYNCYNNQGCQCQ